MQGEVDRGWSGMRGKEEERKERKSEGKSEVMDAVLREGEIQDEGMKVKVNTRGEKMKNSGGSRVMKTENGRGRDEGR